MTYWVMLIFGYFNIEGFWGYLFDFIWIYAMVSIAKMIYYYKFTLLELDILAIFGLISFFIKGNVSFWMLCSIHTVLFLFVLSVYFINKRKENYDRP
jgi:hypothetical protein